MKVTRETYMIKTDRANKTHIREDGVPGTLCGMRARGRRQKKLGWYAHLCPECALAERTGERAPGPVYAAAVQSARENAEEILATEGEGIL